ncbi:hypothetical protein EZV62_010611 [Acer yangbiense]|uniref:Uncharacterized protein n=1 Tax=Acer yangbiense TaxID=1000413 RepID=A0A5C7I2U1_9ROSI|nr:hypothetical protein EZV62_010611 [Acer yangbiense]
MVSEPEQYQQRTTRTHILQWWSLQTLKSLLEKRKKILKAIEGPEKLPDTLTVEQKDDLLEMALGQNLDEFKKMTIELANARDNEKLSDENEAIILLNSLESFKDVKDAIKYGMSSLTLEECISALKSKDLELKIERKMGVEDHVNMDELIENVFNLNIEAAINSTQGTEFVLLN